MWVNGTAKTRDRKLIAFVHEATAAGAGFVRQSHNRTRTMPRAIMLLFLADRL